MLCLRGLFKDKKLIPVKVQDVKRERRIGFVAKSLGELKKKACVKFQVNAQASVLCGFRIPFQLVYEGV